MTRHDESRPGRVPLDDALRSLRRPEDPPPELEERVMGRLIATGAVARSETVRETYAADRKSPTPTPTNRRWAPRQWQRSVAAALACVALFAAGVFAGSRQDASVADGPRYALLLLSGPGLEPAGAVEEAERVREYGAWAGRLAADDRLVLAEKLGATVATIDANGSIDQPAPADEVLGMFVIVADTDADALAAARASPHAAAGGRIAVIRIDPT